MSSSEVIRARELLAQAQTAFVSIPKLNAGQRRVSVKKLQQIVGIEQRLMLALTELTNMMEDIEVRRGFARYA